MTVVYKHYHLEITATDDQEIELKKKLQARSLAVDVKPFKSPIQPHTDDIDEKSYASSKHLKSDTMIALESFKEKSFKKASAWYFGSYQ